jgi:hypothetical protein
MTFRECRHAKRAEAAPALLSEVAALAAYQASHMKHVAGSHWSKLSSAECDHGDRSALSRHELDLEGIIGVAMDDRADVPLLETELGKRPS